MAKKLTAFQLEELAYAQADLITAEMKLATLAEAPETLALELIRLEALEEAGVEVDSDGFDTPVHSAIHNIYDTLRPGFGLHDLRAAYSNVLTWRAEVAKHEGGR